MTTYGALHITGDATGNPLVLSRSRFPRSGVRTGSEGILLIHTADRQLAHPGERISFSTCVINASSEPLEQVCLIPRSFTNAGLGKLTYESRPRTRDLNFGPLAPAAAAGFIFTYTACADDQRNGGGLLSAMMVGARSSSGRRFWDECDALVDMYAVGEEPIRDQGLGSPFPRRAARNGSSRRRDGEPENNSGG